jgi:hypothetical protein
MKSNRIVVMVVGCMITTPLMCMLAVEGQLRELSVKSAVLLHTMSVRLAPEGISSPQQQADYNWLWQAEKEGREDSTGSVSDKK